MPMKKNAIQYPAWVERLDDPCLSRSVREALKARDTAEYSGALEDPSCRAVLKSADTTLEQIEFARVTGHVACEKAATAIRKYTVAAECALPSATRTRNWRKGKKR